MIKEKYAYQSLSRESVNGKRLYATPDGKKLPSVTTILDKTKSEEKKAALANWRKRVGHQKAQQITTEAANRGTRMHTYLERFILNGVHEEKTSNPYSWPSHDMASIVIEQGLHKVDEYWGVEVPLYFPEIYAGTTDLVGVHQGKPAIMDFKQTNKPKKTEWIEDYFLQLCAYGEAHNAVHGTDIKTGVVLMCVKPIEKTDEPGVYTTPPEYQEWILEGADWEKYRNLWWKRVEAYYTQFL